MTIESAGQSVATGARKQILVALAVRERVENVPDARNIGATPYWPLEIQKIDAGEAGVERDCRHFCNPAADKNIGPRTCQHVQAGEKRHLVECQHQHTAKRQTRKNAIAKPAP